MVANYVYMHGHMSCISYSIFIHGYVHGALVFYTCAIELFTVSSACIHHIYNIKLRQEDGMEWPEKTEYAKSVEKVR